MSHSLRRWLILSTVGISLFSWFLAAMLGYWVVREQIDTQRDAQLAQTAQAMLALSIHEVHEERLFALSGVGESHFGEAVKPTDWQPDGIAPEDLAFQIWIEHDRLALRSANAPLLPLSHRNRGFSDALVNGEPWRIYSIQTPDGEVRVQLGERLAARAALNDAVVSRFLLPLLLLIPVLVAGLAWSVRRATQVFSRLSEELTRQAPPRPLELDTLPAEVRPLGEAVNRLIQRLQEAVANERRFTSDAAHELRTPLAALKTQAQVALRTEDPQQREQALRQVMKGVDRAAHLVDQLLTLARLDPERNRAEERPVDLFVLAENVLSDLAPEALDKDIELALNGSRGQFVLANGEALCVLLRNLILNAIRYTPTGGHVEVDVQCRGDRPELVVSDSGPGIPEQERERVFQRFYRGLGTRTPGSGLGLSIVQRIAALNGLEISLGESALGGLKVTVRLPAERLPQSG